MLALPLRLPPLGTSTPHSKSFSPSGQSNNHRFQLQLSRPSHARLTQTPKIPLPPRVATSLESWLDLETPNKQYQDIRAMTKLKLEAASAFRSTLGIATAQTANLHCTRRLFPAQAAGEGYRHCIHIEQVLRALAVAKQQSNSSDIQQATRKVAEQQHQGRGAWHLRPGWRIRAQRYLTPEPRHLAPDFVVKQKQQQDSSNP